jgi:galactokinase/mevalonate kinase-like predicted kinase
VNYISDSALLTELETKTAFERKTTNEVLQLLIEVERRKLHLKLGYQSLYHFAVKHLRYSEGGAHRRISAARLLRSMGEWATPALHKLESGELTQYCKTSRRFRKKRKQQPSHSQTKR